MRIAIIGYGNMGHEIEKAAIAEGIEVVSTIDPDMNKNAMYNRLTSESLDKADLAVDFSLGPALVGNMEFYSHESVPVVMGATGGDRTKLEEIVRMDGRINAVIGVNMAAPIVALTWALNSLAGKTSSQDYFYGFSGEAEEEHQFMKLDQSGTALNSFMPAFRKMGLDFDSAGGLRSKRRRIQARGYHYIDMTSKAVCLDEEKDIASFWCNVISAMSKEFQGCLDGYSARVEGSLKNACFRNGITEDLVMLGIDPITTQLERESAFDYMNIDISGLDNTMRLGFYYNATQQLSGKPRGTYAGMYTEVDQRDVYVAGVIRALYALMGLEESGKKGVVLKMPDVLREK